MTDKKKRSEPDNIYDRLSPSAAKRAKTRKSEVQELSKYNTIEELIFNIPVTFISREDVSRDRFHIYDAVDFFNRHNLTFGKHYNICDTCSQIFLYTNAFQPTKIYQRANMAFCSCCLNECNLCSDWYLTDDMETHICKCLDCGTEFPDGPDLDHPCHEEPLSANE